MIRRRFFVLAMASVALMLMFSAPVVASAVSAGGPVEVQIWPQDGQTVVISSVALPTGTKLPALVRIPVVPGSVVEWAGEIAGSDPAGDTAVQYKLAQGAGGLYAEFYLTKSLRGQIDTVASTLTVSGQRTSSEVAWVQSVTAPETIFSVRIPSGASDVRITPSPDGKPTTNELGEALYLLPSRALGSGEKLNVSLSWGAAVIETPSATPSANTIIVSLLVVLALAIAALVVVARRRRTR